MEGLGVNIDIFPLDGTSESRTVASCRTALLLCFHALRVLKSVSHKPERGHAKSFVLVVSKLLLSPFSGLILARALDHLARRITYASGERVRSSAGPYGTRELIDRSCYDGFVELNFEGSQFRAPVGYELLLCQLYGDFMALPPPEKRVSHHAFRAFRKT